MGESWIVSNLNAALSTWNDKLAEIWSLLTESPQTFKGGQVWGVMTGIHGALQAIGYGLLVLFFAVGVMKTCGSFVEVKKPEHALKLFIRFALAKGAVSYGLELMLAVFSIVQVLPPFRRAFSRRPRAGGRFGRRGAQTLAGAGLLQPCPEPPCRRPAGRGRLRRPLPDDLRRGAFVAQAQPGSTCS